MSVEIRKTSWLIVVSTGGVATEFGVDSETMKHVKAIYVQNPTSDYPQFTSYDANMHEGKPTFERLTAWGLRPLGAFSARRRFRRVDLRPFAKLCH